jgi:radical SAM superfamily enzyme YgiQ (UPF0313 family)
VRGEGEEETPKLATMAMDDQKHADRLPGILCLNVEGPPPDLIRSLDALNPTGDLLPKRKKYIFGVLDPAGCVEFTRGCPWDSVFCSAWTFNRPSSSRTRRLPEPTPSRAYSRCLGRPAFIDWVANAPRVAAPLNGFICFLSSN